MVDYDLMLTADFHPYFKNLRLPPLYITNCESRSLNISQQVPSIKTWGGVHFDDWGEGEITLDVQGIVAPFRGYYNHLPDDWKSQYHGDPVFNNPQSMYYLAFQDNRLGVTVKETLGYKHFLPNKKKKPK